MGLMNCKGSFRKLSILAQKKQAVRGFRLISSFSFSIEEFFIRKEHEDIEVKGFVAI